MDNRIEERKNFYSQKLDISNERENHSLSLRKKKLENNYLKRRMNNLEEYENISKYKINAKLLNINEEYKKLSFQSLKETLDGCDRILTNDNKKDNIYFAILYLQKIQFKSDDTTLLQSNIPKHLFSLLKKYIDDIILVNEVLTIRITITFFCKIEICYFFSEISFLNLYNQLLNKYINNDTIIFDLITIFGNLSCGNYKIQKLFYETKMVEVIKKLYDSTLIGDKKREYYVWFFACFMNNIQINYYFKENIDFFIWGINFFCENIIYEQMTHYCLLGMSYLCNVENKKVINYILSKDNFFNYILSLPSKYFEIICRILCDISSINDEINLLIIKKYNLTEFILRGLNSQLIKFQISTLYLLNNYVNDENKEIKKILLDNGIINKILELSKSYITSVVHSSLLCISSLLLNSSDEMIYILYQKKIIGIIMEIISKNYDVKILEIALDSIISILKRDNSNDLYKRQFENYGISELLSKIYIEKKNKNIEKIAGQLLQEYFSSPLN